MKHLFGQCSWNTVKIINMLIRRRVILWRYHDINKYCHSAHSGGTQYNAYKCLWWALGNIQAESLQPAKPSFGWLWDFDTHQWVKHTWYWWCHLEGDGSRTLSLRPPLCDQHCSPPARRHTAMLQRCAISCDIHLLFRNVSKSASLRLSWKHWASFERVRGNRVLGEIRHSIAMQ